MVKRVFNKYRQQQSIIAVVIKKNCSRKKIFALIVVLLFGAVYLVFWLFVGQPDFRKSVINPSEVSAQKLEQHVKTLSVDFLPRSGSHLGNLKRTADYIYQEFSTLGTGQVTNKWFQVDAKRYRNVSLLIGDETVKRIVVGAHYDAFYSSPGADDNASGIAGLIELAGLFAKNPIETPVEFVGYTLEEPPYFNSKKMGSWQHVDRIPVECKYMISVEMIGYFSDEKKSQKYPLPLLKLIYPTKGNFIAVVGDLKNRSLIRNFKIGMKGSSSLPVYSISAPASVPGLDFSDHRNYWAAGIPALMVTDTAEYRNEEYHTANDTYDRLDYDRLAMVVKGLESAIRRLEGRSFK